MLMDIFYLAAKRKGGYFSLGTDIDGKNCFGINSSGQVKKKRGQKRSTSTHKCLTVDMDKYLLFIDQSERAKSNIHLFSVYSSHILSIAFSVIYCTFI